jgi:hypothetical protein
MDPDARPMSADSGDARPMSADAAPAPAPAPGLLARLAGALGFGRGSGPPSSASSDGGASSGQEEEGEEGEGEKGGGMRIAHHGGALEAPAAPRRAVPCHRGVASDRVDACEVGGLGE